LGRFVTNLPADVIRRAAATLARRHLHRRRAAATLARRRIHRRRAVRLN